MAVLYRECPICKKYDFRKLVTVAGNRGCDYINYNHTFVICENCGLCFLNPQNAQEDYTRYYSDHGITTSINPDPREEFNNETEKQYHKEYELIAEYIDRTLQFPDLKIEILDIGAGKGNFLYAFNKLGYSNLIGLELSEKLISYADTIFGQKIIKGSLERNDLPKENYDLILATSMLDHLCDPLYGLLQMRSLLKVGGYLFVRVHNIKDMVLRKGVNAFFKFVHIYNFSENSLSNLIRMAGFEIYNLKIHPSLLEHSSLLSPANYRLGMINIIAKKTESSNDFELIRDYADEIADVFQKARNRDSAYEIIHRVLLSRYGKFARSMLNRLFRETYIPALKKIYLE